VGETFRIRANQATRASTEWSSSDSFRPLFVCHLQISATEPHFRSVLPRNDQPFHNVGFNWNRVLSRDDQRAARWLAPTVIGQTFDWAGIGNGNALYGIAGSAHCHSAS
jgi:hypothetical protein